MARGKSAGNPFSSELKQLEEMKADDRWLATQVETLIGALQENQADWIVWAGEVSAKLKQLATLAGEDTVEEVNQLLAEMPTLKEIEIDCCKDSS